MTAIAKGAAGGCHPYLRNVSAFSVNFHLNRWRYSHVTSFLANHAAMFLGPWACGSECCSSNPNAPDTCQKGLIGIQSYHSKEKMSKKAREKPAEAGSASVSPYGSVPSYELVTSQPNRLINLIWPECRTWFIGPWGRRHKVLIGDGFMGTQTHIHPKFSFSSDFGQFIMKIFAKSKFLFRIKKVAGISSFLGGGWGYLSRSFLDWGTRPPVPAFGAHDDSLAYCSVPGDDSTFLMTFIHSLANLTHWGGGGGGLVQMPRSASKIGENLHLFPDTKRNPSKVNLEKFLLKRTEVRE